MKKILAILTVTAAIVFSACHKVPDLEQHEQGVSVILATSTTLVVPTPADSTKNVINFSWTSPDYSTDTNSYKYVLEIDSTGRDFAKKTTRIITGVRNVSLTGKEVNDILLNYGFALGSANTLDVRIVSSQGNNNERRESNIVQISVVPYNDPSVLTSAETSVTLNINNATQTANTFSWTRSFNGYSGVVNYSLQYDSATKGFAFPVDIPINAGDLTKAISHAELNNATLVKGIPGGSTGRLEFRIMAQTAQGALSYSNVVSLTITSYVPILRFYLPGSYQAATGNGTNWDPPSAPELIRDVRANVFNDMYYIYIYLPANTEFKVTQGRDWAINYGGTGGNLALGSSDNLKVTTAGYYRVTINRSTLKYDIREGRMGFVGGGTGAAWEPPDVFPTYQMGFTGTNLFTGVVDLTSSEWKMIDNSVWNNGSFAVDETRSYGGGVSGSTMEVNGGNFPPYAAGRYRVIWDGRDVDNIKYQLAPVTEMRVVGDGIDQVGVNEWDPPTSPQMTYSAIGVWTITIALKANKDFKFVAGNAWGAFDYEDNSGQSQATGTAKKIKWASGDNFKTPTVAGTYTITLNENTQSVTIN
jgi:starch-binding outer membrane protein SusE/F